MFELTTNDVIAGVAWIVLPLTYEYVSSNFRFNSWRLFTVLCGIPSLLSAVAVTFLPESPRYLLSQGDEEGALKVLRRVFKANTGQPVHMFPVRRADLFQCSFSAVSVQFQCTLQVTFY